MLTQVVRNNTRKLINGIFLISKRGMFFVYHNVYFSPSLLKNTGITETNGRGWCPGEDLNISGRQHFINKYNTLPVSSSFEFHLRSTHQSAHFIGKRRNAVCPFISRCKQRIQVKALPGQNPTRLRLQFHLIFAAGLKRILATAISPAIACCC
jgi:hypothetical protein